MIFIPLIIAAVAVFWLLSGGPASESPQAPVSVAVKPATPDRGAKPVAPVEQPSMLVGKVNEAAPPRRLPKSLSGTSVPAGWAKVDSSGALIPTAELRQMFEYYLSALGEESLQQLVARIESTLSILEEPARSQALETLGAYLDYKLAVSDLESAFGDSTRLSPIEMQQRMEEIQALRRSWLDSETADVFFAQEEAVDRFQIEKLRIAGNDTLSKQQKQEALARAEAALPEPLRAARKETRRFADYEQARREMADNPEALQAWREQAFGTDTAKRLAELEREQQAWDQRWQAYSQDRKKLMMSGLAGPELEAAIGHLRGQHFSETEQVRAKALDSIR
ncbi:lipase [Marinobacter salinus]|uniref:Lipase chaperone n=1 Tax=Marinobacter salinus TaxID=1874317 RepID=A0A1D9GRT4_9GAMM|nr:lipase [Marinobacter salinus]